MKIQSKRSFKGTKLIKWIAKFFTTTKCQRPDHLLKGTSQSELSFLPIYLFPRCQDQKCFKTCAIFSCCSNRVSITLVISGHWRCNRRLWLQKELQGLFPLGPPPRKNLKSRPRKCNFQPSAGINHKHLKTAVVIVVVVVEFALFSIHHFYFH